MDQFFADPLERQRLRAGPLGTDIDRFAARLSERGYERSSARLKIRLVAELSRWLHRHRLGVAQLNEAILAGYIRTQARRGCVHKACAVTYRQLLELLRDAGEIPRAPRKIDESELHQIEQRFERYLTQERGLSQATLRNTLPFIRRFLVERFGQEPILFRALRPSDVTGFVLRGARTMSPSRAKLMVGALRSFFRFLRFQADIAIDLAAVVPTVASWRLSRLPRFIDAAQVELLLKSCDQHRATGRRDYAVLLLLARLGLRAGEIVALTLDDIDWEAGEVTILGKGGRRDRLPLPNDVGEALVAYLRGGRPRSSSRRVFLRAKAPQGEIEDHNTIGCIVRRALRRAGVESAHKGAHLLRHSLATEMLRRGASLPEIGDILRHQQLETTTIYAKVDLNALRPLARPWPGVEA